MSSSRRAASLWSCSDTSSFCTPSWRSRPAVWRVSSAAMMSAFASTSRARGRQISQIADRRRNQFDSARGHLYNLRASRHASSDHRIFSVTSLPRTTPSPLTRNAPSPAVIRRRSAGHRRLRRAAQRHRSRSIVPSGFRAGVMRQVRPKCTSVSRGTIRHPIAMTSPSLQHALARRESRRRCATRAESCCR